MKNRKRAFTLIELLVVVAIIALLIAILLPGLSRAKKLANRTKCLANVRGLGQSALLYAYDYKNFWPYNATPTSFWVNLLKQYAQVDKLRICPEAKQTSPINGTSTAST